MENYYLINEDFFDDVDSELISSSALDDIEDIKNYEKYEYDCVIIVSSISSNDENSNNIAVEEAKKLLKRLSFFLEISMFVKKYGSMDVYASWMDIGSSDLSVFEYPNGLKVYHKNNRSPFITTSFGIRVPITLKKMTTVKSFMLFCKNFLKNQENLSRKLHVYHIKLKDEKTQNVIELYTSFYSTIKEMSETNFQWNNLPDKTDLYESLTYIFGTGIIQKMRDYLGVNDDMRIIERLEETKEKRTRKKIFECSAKTANINVDLFADYVYILSNKDIRMIYSTSGYDSNMRPFIATWEGFADLLREQNAGVRAYLFHKSSKNSFVAVYILTNTVYDDEEEMDYCLVCNLPENQCYTSDYRCGSIADFLTPFVVMGYNSDKILSKPAFSYLSDAEKEEIQEMIDRNIKKGVID